MQLPGTEDAKGPFFSADGRVIGFFAAGQLKTVSARDAEAVTVTDVSGQATGASWGVDDMIVYAELDGIFRVPGTGGTPELLIPADEGEFLYGPQMLPGGEWILFTVRGLQSEWDDAQIVAQSLTSNQREVLVEGGRDGRYLATGHLVYCRNNVLSAVSYDLETRETGGAVRLVEGVRDGGGAYLGRAAAHFAVSVSGSLVYVPAEDDPLRSLVWVGRDGTEEVLAAPYRDYQKSWVSI